MDEPLGRELRRGKEGLGPLTSIRGQGQKPWGGSGGQEGVLGAGSGSSPGPCVSFRGAA